MDKEYNPVGSKIEELLEKTNTFSPSTSKPLARGLARVGRAKLGGFGVPFLTKAAGNAAMNINANRTKLAHGIRDARAGRVFSQNKKAGVDTRTPQELHNNKLSNLAANIRSQTKDPQKGLMSTPEAAKQMKGGWFSKAKTADEAYNTLINPANLDEMNKRYKNPLNNVGFAERMTNSFYDTAKPLGKKIGYSNSYVPTPVEHAPAPTPIDIITNPIANPKTTSYNRQPSESDLEYNKRIARQMGQEGI